MTQFPTLLGNDMPTMANITVKKNDGTTDQIWTSVQASGGDRSPAIWRNTSVGTAAAFNPEMRMTSRPNADLTVRRVEGSISWPQSVVGTDGVTRKVNTFSFKFEGVVPQGMPAADLNEAASQSTNLVASVLFKDSLKQGFAPA
jgi:hypothetical protein